MPAYPRMKDSGVKWIGQLPAHWRLSRVKDSYRVILGKMLTPSKERPGQTLENYLCAANIKWGGVDTSVQKQMWFSQQDKETYHLCSGDVLIAEGGLAGTSCIYDGELNPCYIQNSVHCCRTKGQDLSKFLYYWMYAVCCSGYVDAVCNRATIQHYTKEKVIATPVVMPPVSEQLLIVAYLDRVCSDVDTAIAEAKASVEEHKLLKQSVITQAVTKGIDPNVPMKDSGVWWIGPIPQEWALSKVKFVSEFAPKVSSAFNRDLPVGYVPMDCVKNGYMIAKEALLSDMGTGLVRFQEGDIVMAKVTPCFENGNIAIGSGLSQRIAFGSSELFVFRSTAIDRRYLFYYLQTQDFKQMCAATMTGTAGLKRVSADFVRNAPIPVPTTNDQQRISSYLDDCCARIDGLVAEKQSIAADLESYKKSLIYEVVTGKRRVA